MKKIILLLLLAVSTIACSKETNKPVICLDAKEMFDAIFEEYRETILMVFDQDSFTTKIVLTVNLKITIVQKITWDLFIGFD